MTTLSSNTCFLSHSGGSHCSPDSPDSTTTFRGIYHIPVKLKDRAKIWSICSDYFCCYRICRNCSVSVFPRYPASCCSVLSFSVSSGCLPTGIAYKHRTDRTVCISRIGRIQVRWKCHYMICISLRFLLMFYSRCCCYCSCSFLGWVEEGFSALKDKDHRNQLTLYYSLHGIINRNSFKRALLKN